MAVAVTVGLRFTVKGYNHEYRIAQVGDDKKILVTWDWDNEKGENAHYTYADAEKYFKEGIWVPVILTK